MAISWRLTLDGTEMDPPLAETAWLVDVVSLFDRVLFKEGKRVAKASTGDGRELLKVQNAMRCLKELKSVALESEPIPSEPSRAVVTMNIGSACDEMFSVSSLSFKEYAKRVGADFRVIDSAKVNMHQIYFEKLQVFDLLYEYDRVLFVDSDVLIAPDCPDLFTFVSPADFGGYDEEGVQPGLAERRTIVQMMLGDCGWKDFSFNSGVMVASWMHRPVFKPGSTPDPSPIAEQNFLNHRVASMKCPVHKLPKEFNRMDMAGLDEDRFKSFVIHYAGRGYTSYFHPDPKERGRRRTAIMRADWDWFDKNRRPRSPFRA